jgi:hypothetical protein
MGFSIFETNKLTLIPAYVPGIFEVYGYHDIGLENFTRSPYAICGGCWVGNVVNSWIEFGFNGSILGIMFGAKYGKIDLIVDGNTIVTDFDVSQVKGNQYNFSYIFAEDLTEGNHLARIVVKQTPVIVEGILVDARVNYFDFPIFPRNNFYSVSPWYQKSVTAGETSPDVEVLFANSLLIYVKVSSATTITLQIDTIDGFQDYDSLTFTGAGYNYFIVWTKIANRIRFKSSAATTVTVEVRMFK